MSNREQTKKNLSTTRAALFEVESGAWKAVSAGWRQLYGSFRDLGISFEWHDFIAKERLDWAKSFHAGSIEICLNLSGQGEVITGSDHARYEACFGGFYRQGKTALQAWRSESQRHQFLTVEFSREFLQRRFQEHLPDLHPLVASAIRDNGEASGVTAPQRLTAEQQQILRSLQHPPVFAKAQSVWYESKALEMAALFFFQSPQTEAFFCTRQKQTSRDRVAKVIALLQSNLCDPPPLEEIGRQVGCSHFYLSRTFSTEMGMTIQQYLRQLRLEKAATLLREGKHNVTEAALEVGYSSLSHFTQAFRESFGCCPGLYPLAPASKDKRN